MRWCGPRSSSCVRSDDAPDPGRPAVEGTVESSLYLGTATQFVVRLGDSTGMTVLVPNSDESARRRLPGAGDQVRLAWANEHIHIVREAEGPDAPPTESETAVVA